MPQALLQRKYNYRRRLPHYQKDDRSLFVTFRAWSKDVLAETVRDAVLQHCLHDDRVKLHMHAVVVMPDHVHLIITPAVEISLERAVQFIKGGFSHSLGRGSIWQASFTNHRIRDYEDYERHREYVWLNPVRAKLAARAEEYLYSSAAGRLRVDPVPQGLKPCSSLAS